MRLEAKNNRTRSELADIAKKYCLSRGAVYTQWHQEETFLFATSLPFTWIMALLLGALTVINAFTFYGIPSIAAFTPLIFTVICVRSMRNALKPFTKYSAYLVDFYFIMLLAGIGYLLFISYKIDRTIINAPMQIGLFAAGVHSFHSTTTRNVVRNIALCILAMVITYVSNPDYFFQSLIQCPTAIIGSLYINRNMHRERELRFYNKQTHSLEKQHAFKQLSSAFYPHQVEAMEKGKNLDETMPVGHSQAYVLCFDIINSSKVLMEGFYEVRDRIFERCYAAMMENYQTEPLRAKAHRIKEMGDGFLCSVGFPFALPDNSKGSDIALELANQFLDILDEEIAAMDYAFPIYASIGIAFGPVEAYYPKAGLKLYDLRDSAIILATRYESMRKVILPELAQQTGTMPQGHILTLSERVYANLRSEDREKFTLWEVTDENKAVRDDPEARRVYFQLINGQVSVDRVS